MSGAGSGNMVNCEAIRVWSIYLSKRSVPMVTEGRLRQPDDDLQCRERPTGKIGIVNPCKDCARFDGKNAAVALVSEFGFSYLYISLTALYACR